MSCEEDVKEMEDVQEGKIQAISSQTVHRICSGQVILSLSIAVKELLENSIDARATNIEIKLKNYGMDLVEVIDNGSGVNKDNFEALTLKSYTSKIRQFTDLEFVSTLGFRGEALSSLCALSELSVTTRHSSDDHGTKIKYDKNGKIVKKEPVARQVGTTVSLANLFTPIPVRRKEFVKNHKREFNKMCNLLYAYCLVSTGIKISCTNITSKGNQCTVVNTRGLSSVKENIISVFGAKQISSLIEVELIQPDESVAEEFGLTRLAKEESPFHFEFFISSVIHGSGRSASDRQFYFVNSRPCDIPKLMKLVNDIYRQFNVHQYPFVYLNVRLKSSCVDVNVTPDKRMLFLEKEKLLLATVKSTLLESFKLFPSMYKMESLNESKVNKRNSPMSDKSFNFFQKKPKFDEPGCSRKLDLESFKMNNSEVELEDSDVVNSDEDTEAGPKNKPKYLERKSTAGKSAPRQIEDELVELVNRLEYVEDAIPEPKNEMVKLVSKLHEEESENNKNVFETTTIEEITVSEPRDKLSDLVNMLNEEDCAPEPPDNLTMLVNTMDEEKEEEEASKSTRDNTEMKLSVTIAEFFTTYESHKMPRDNTVHVTPAITVIPSDGRATTQRNIYHQNRKTVYVNLTIDYLRDVLFNDQKKGDKSKFPDIKFHYGIAPQYNDKAAIELQRHLAKDQFANMTIIGQFNHAFIITKLGSDLFIIDQHASDEKFNFENLQKDYVIPSQRLICPKNLELTAAYESILMDNLDVFSKNGFGFIIDEQAEATKKVKLTKIPLSKSVIFGPTDIDEMLYMLQEGYSKNCRPTRIREMFASRACRKSVMFGKVLSTYDMRLIVQHMGTIDQPWNCPHGRPTMRHLVNIDLLTKMV